jgi:tetratricopeptide (TPR) repeat protein
VIYENAGVSYFNMGEYQKCIPYFDKVIAMQTSRDGKSEYFKGVAHYNLGNKAEGCKWVAIANNKGFKEAAVILQNNCK